jgi:hypothetical protein
MGTDVSATYQITQTPCVFLDLKTKDCTAYAYRPASCRVHYVASPPENCAPDKPHERVAYFDLTAQQQAAWRHGVGQTMDVIPNAIGFFQEMVLAGMELLTRTPRDFDRWAKTANLGDLFFRCAEAERAGLAIRPNGEPPRRPV